MISPEFRADLLFSFAVSEQSWGLTPVTLRPSASLCSCCSKVSCLGFSRKLGVASFAIPTHLLCCSLALISWKAQVSPSPHLLHGQPAKRQLNEHWYTANCSFQGYLVIVFLLKNRWCIFQLREITVWERGEVAPAPSERKYVGIYDSYGHTGCRGLCFGRTSPWIPPNSPGLVPAQRIPLICQQSVMATGQSRQQSCKCSAGAAKCGQKGAFLRLFPK